MTTNEAKEYLIKYADYTESDFELPTDEDLACEFAKEGEWVCNYFVPYPVSEHEMKTAIELARDHKFWNDEKQVDAYLDFMMSN